MKKEKILRKLLSFALAMGIAASGAGVGKTMAFAQNTTIAETRAVDESFLRDTMGAGAQNMVTLQNGMRAVFMTP